MESRLGAFETSYPTEDPRLEEKGAPTRHEPAGTRSLGQNAWSRRADRSLHEALNVKKGAKLLVLMDDDSVVKLYADRDFRTKAVYDVDVDGNYGVDARVTALYTLDTESAGALTSGEAMVIRVAIESGRLGLSGQDNSINFGTNSQSKHFFKDAVLCLQQDHSAEST